MKEICKNCGQREEMHYLEQPSGKRSKNCKKFEAYPDTLEGNYDHLEQKGCVFVEHIQSHLKDNEEVICTICNKTHKEICPKCKASQDEVPKEVIDGFIKKGLEKLKTKKGCGKSLYPRVEDTDCGEYCRFCKEKHYCNDCKPKNHKEKSNE
ncbi:hypothetical protein LCGC14_1454690 [marine sediment metagenome]|uniref:Uncharacterized protein n=1 Tax=marine sediment metagenome TaxID=412755 RepID=A0A0F9JGR0_9ZZZZ